MGDVLHGRLQAIAHGVCPQDRGISFWLVFGKQWDGRSHLHGIEMCQSGDANQPLEQTGASDMKVTTVGIDLA
ncbi:hypothetical protein, partial [Limnohabitans sp. Jir72]|uniref:hypothetical protein n=1 Tax=Limnohabitans sp. Jir72 TaxID=1977909 RepID=UPI001E417603